MAAKFANHGEVAVWNLLPGDIVIVGALLATVHAEPTRGMTGPYDGWHRAEFLVYEIPEDGDGVAQTGEWIAVPRTFARWFEPGATLPLIQTGLHLQVRDL